MQTSEATEEEIIIEMLEHDLVAKMPPVNKKSIEVSIDQQALQAGIFAATNRLFEILYRQSFKYREDPPFKLVSGRESPYYFDCKATTLEPEGCFLVGLLVFNEIKNRNLDIQGIGGLTLGADPIALSTSLAAYREGVNIKPLIVRKEAKSHGTQKWIEGRLEGVKRVVVVDDVITTGSSTIKAIERMRESGLEVRGVIVLVDREEGGRENIEKHGVEVYSLFKRSEFDERIWVDNARRLSDSENKQTKEILDNF